MRNLIIILCIFLYTDSFAQTDNSFKELIKDVTRNLFPPSVGGDTCYHYSSLLIMKIDKKSKLTNLIFSDNAPEWMFESLTFLKEQQKINFKMINKSLREKKIKNMFLIFPITYVSAFKCIPSNFEYHSSDDKKYFSVAGKLLNGNIQICKPEVIGIQRSY